MVEILQRTPPTSEAERSGVVGNNERAATAGTIKKLVWVTSTLHTAGGGSRLLLEGVKYYRSLGMTVHIITWDFDDEALFDGTYSADGIHVIAPQKPRVNSGIFIRSMERLGTLWRLRSLIVKLQPDIIYNQSEYDCTLLYLTLAGTRFRYATLIFGQMFQFHNDIAKYTFKFRKHLREIRNSTAGYRELVPEACPPTGLFDRFAAEVINFIRYFAVRKSKRIFVFSKQVQWEVSKLYGMDAAIKKGAYPRALLGQRLPELNSQIRTNPEEKIVLSLSRLIKKKRVDLKIRAVHHLVSTHRIPNLRLIIGGKGEDAEELRILCAQLGMEKHVSFIGYVPEKDVYPLTADCDAYMSLDVADFDISPYEALALKRPVIWSTEMDRDEYLESCPAVIAVEPTVLAVADALERALSIDITAVDWSGLESYSWEHYFQSMLNMVQLEQPSK